MRRIIATCLSIALICCFFASYVNASNVFQTRQGVEAANKKAKEVELRVIRDRAKFLKKKLEELQSGGQKEISQSDSISQGVAKIIEGMNDINMYTDFPTKVAYPDDKGLFKVRYDISQLLLKLEEVIAIIDSIIGPEKPASQD